MRNEDAIILWHISRYQTQRIRTYKMLIQSDVLGRRGNKWKKQECIGCEVYSRSTVYPASSDELYICSAELTYTGWETTNFESLNLDIFVGKIETLRDDNINHLPGIQFRSLKKTRRGSSDVHCRKP